MMVIIIYERYIEYGETMNNLELGTCIKNTNKEVIFQNGICIDSCGDMKGIICDKGCMASYSLTPGMTLIKNSQLDNGHVDAVVINDGRTLTTLLYPYAQNQDDLLKIKNELLSYGLSKSEVTIFLLVITGKKNRDIVKELFISKSTLKTHLNNIYKKLPVSFQSYKNRS